MWAGAGLCFGWGDDRQRPPTFRRSDCVAQLDPASVTMSRTCRMRRGVVRPHLRRQLTGACSKRHRADSPRRPQPSSALRSADASPELHGKTTTTAMLVWCCARLAPTPPFVGGEAASAGRRLRQRRLVEGEGRRRGRRAMAAGRARVAVSPTSDAPSQTAGVGGGAVRRLPFRRPAPVVSAGFGLRRARKARDAVLFDAEAPPPGSFPRRLRPHNRQRPSRPGRLAVSVSAPARQEGKSTKGSRPSTAASSLKAPAMVPCMTIAHHPTEWAALRPCASLSPPA
jgi:hypothetical protein